MNARERLIWAAIVVVVLGLLGTAKLGPRLYNRVRLHEVQGRKIYDEHLDTNAAFERELTRANREGKRLLVILGGNWCQWCLVLDDLMHTDPDLRAQLDAHFVVLKLDSAAASALDERWGRPSRNGVPVMIFVDSKGEAKHVQETGSLERWHGRLLAHDPARVLEVLKRWS